MDADVLVIGAGVVGLACVAELARDALGRTATVPTLEHVRLRRSDFALSQYLPPKAERGLIRTISPVRFQGSKGF